MLIGVRAIGTCTRRSLFEGSRREVLTLKALPPSKLDSSFAIVNGQTSKEEIDQRRHSKRYRQDQWGWSQCSLTESDEEEAEDIIDDEAEANKRDDIFVAFHHRGHFEMHLYTQEVCSSRGSMLFVYQKVIRLR